MYGGGGKNIEIRGALLANHGFVTYSLPYMYFKDLPKSFEDIEYTYFQEAIWYLQSLDYVLPGIDIVGISFGGGMAVWLSAVEKEIVRRVVVIGPGHHFLSPGKWKGKTYPATLEPLSVERVVSGKVKDEHGAIFPDLMTYDSSCESYMLPIEQSADDTRFLFIVGEDDCNLYAKKCHQILYERMVKYGKERQMQSLVYPNTGHFLDPPYLPSIHGLYLGLWDFIIRNGGTKERNACACKHSWSQIIKFLKE